MLDRSKMGRTCARDMGNRMHLACKDKGRSELDLLHRFIAQLKLPGFQIEKVNIQEPCCSAKVIMEGPFEPDSDDYGFSSLFKCNRLKAEIELTLNLDLCRLDPAGRHFFMDYDFEIRCSQTAHNDDADFGKDVHNMMQTAFEGFPSFSISLMSDVESI